MPEILFFEFSLDDVFCNLALEDILIEQVSDGNLPPLVRIWQNPVSVIPGISRLIQNDTFVEQIEADHITLARRTSGGGTVYHDQGTLSYSFFFPWTMIGFESDPRSVNETTIDPFIQIIIDSLATFGLKAVKSGISDIFVEGKKVSGNAQKRKKGAILHHGTILMSVDLDRMSRYLKIPPERKGIPHESFVTSLKTLGLDIGVGQLKDRLTKTLDKNHTCKEIQFESEYPELIEKAKNLAEGSLKDRSWIFRR
jgi:lipoate-protein ligase A